MRRTIVPLVALAMIAVGCAAEESPAPAPTDTPVAAAGDTAHGEELFASTCASCHGPDAAGLPNLGANLIGNEFVASNSDADMVEFLLVGRAADDPANTVGVAMPPKGGNPSLNDQDLADLVAYLRSLG